MAIMQSHACIQQQGLGTLPWWRIVEAFQLCKAAAGIGHGWCTVYSRIPVPWYLGTRTYDYPVHCADFGYSTVVRASSYMYPSIHVWGSSATRDTGPTNKDDSAPAPPVATTVRVRV